MELPPDESGAVDADADADDSPERIEVHVHVHRDGAKKSRSKRPPPPALTGVLFDWQWYKDRLTRRAQEPKTSRWSRTVKCQSCEGLFPSSARYCPRCAAPRMRRPLGGIVRALIGLGSVGLVFALCAYFLGGSVPESRAPAPLGQWSSDEIVIVEVPAPAPSLLDTVPSQGYTAEASAPASGSATR